MKIEGLLSNGWKRNVRPSLARRLLAGCLRRQVLGLFAVVLSMSCGGVPKTYYYTLQMPAPPARNDPKTTFVLGVEHFRAVEMLRDDRIVYYESPTEVNFYQYHRWGSDPASMLSELAAAWIQSAGAFADVRMLPTREPVDYILRGRLHNFEEVDYPEGGKGRVSLELTLLRLRDHKVVWSAEPLAETPVQEKGVAAVVRALNDSSQQLLRDALPGLIAQVEQDYKGHTP